MKAIVPQPPFVKFKVPGRPVPKARPRLGRGGRTYTPKRSADYESQVAAEAALSMFGKKPLEGPAEIFIDLYFNVAKSMSLKKKREILEGGEGKILGMSYPIPCTVRVDADNCVKSVCDSLNGIVFKDDSQLVMICVEKNWCWPGDERTEIEVNAR